MKSWLLHEGLVLISSDRKFEMYDVELIVELIKV